MSQFLLLLCEDENAYAAADDALNGEIYAEHEQFATKHGAALRGGNALQPVAAGRIVRGSGVTDAPFAETKEALGGYYLVEARDLDQALSLARSCPMGLGAVEVRPVWEIPGM